MYQMVNGKLIELTFPASHVLSPALSQFVGLDGMCFTHMSTVHSNSSLAADSFEAVKRRLRWSIPAQKEIELIPMTLSTPSPSQATMEIGVSNADDGSVSVSIKFVVSPSSSSICVLLYRSMDVHSGEFIFKVNCKLCEASVHQSSLMHTEASSLRHQKDSRDWGFYSIGLLTGCF